MATPTITVAYGDGHAPGVMEAVLTILREAGANIRIESIEIGSRIYAMDSDTGILPLAWRILARNGVLLMAPIEMPEDKEVTDTGVVIRKRMGLPDEPLLFIDPITNEATARAYKNEHFALFEPVYSDETLQGKKSDPSPMLHAAIMMLVHVGDYATASKIHNAWLAATEEDLAKKKIKRLEKLTQAIIDRLGKRPATMPAAQYKAESESENDTGQLADNIV